MIALKPEEIKKLNIGDLVIYREQEGQLSGHRFEAEVIGKYTNFITLSVLANKISGARFTTSFQYDDGNGYGGSTLYKYDWEDLL